MIIVVDLGTSAVSLVDGDDFTAFHVLVEGAARHEGADAVASVLGGDGASIDESHVFVAVDAVRRLAAPSDDEWERGFAAMRGYAESKGWTSPDGSMIRAHLEWAGRGGSPA